MELSSLDKKSIATPTASGEKSPFMPRGEFSAIAFSIWNR
jgi:hypothetical protein